MANVFRAEKSNISSDIDSSTEIRHRNRHTSPVCNSTAKDGKSIDSKLNAVVGHLWAFEQIRRFSTIGKGMMKEYDCAKKHCSSKGSCWVVNVIGSILNCNCESYLLKIRGSFCLKRLDIFSSRRKTWRH